MGSGHGEGVWESWGRAAWDLLCIASGSAAGRRAGFDDAICLRELPEAELLRQVIEGGGRLQVVGAGFIGCEVAAAARRRGCAVTIFEAMAQPLQRVLGAELGGYVANVHREHGVDLRLDVAPSTDHDHLV